MAHGVGLILQVRLGGWMEKRVGGGMTQRLDP